MNMRKIITVGASALPALLVAMFNRKFGATAYLAARARGCRRPRMTYPSHGERAGLRYSRNRMHEQQRASHDPSWQAMNPHLRAHLFGAPAT